MQGIYEKERATILQARKDFPKLSAFRLAKYLENQGDSRYVGLAGRTFYSIYSVIRRFDKKQAKTT